MADSIKDRVADAAKNAGNAIVEGAKDAKDWVAEKTGMGQKEGCAPGSGRVEERMDVIASYGKKVGVVDHVEGGAIKLTRKDSPDGQHHFIPMGWVDHVDSHVHLKKNSMETEQGWKADASMCGTCGS